MPAHVVYGDTFLVARRLDEIRTRAGAGDLMESNRQRVVAAQAQPAEVLAMCYSMPFLEPIRFIEIEGAVATQEPSGGGRGAAATRGRANRRGGGNPGGWMQLVEAIPQFPDSTVLVFIDAALSDRNPLLRALSEHATIHRENAPTGANLDRWIKQAAEQKGASIAPPAIRALSDMVGNDLWALDRELEKLALYAGNRGINESDARTLVSHAQETNIFTAVDAIVDGRPGEAHRLLAQLMDEGREPQYLIAMIERQLRLIALARDLSDRSVAPAEMGRRMGTSSDFVVRKTLGQARRTPLSDISRMYQRVLRSDLDIKTGRLDPAVSLELLVADLTGLP
jgi:DNA polymerase-3 subunit delta